MTLDKQFSTLAKTCLPSRFGAKSVREVLLKGHVPTPDHLVDEMVERLFDAMEPASSDSLLDPGCGGGAFISGVLRWFESKGVAPPRIVGVELNPSLVAKARKRFSAHPTVQIVQADYLLSPESQSFRFIIGDPPYVSLGNLGGENKRNRYRKRFSAARGRFDLYMLFIERSIELLEENGRLVFITPEKYLYVAAATELRRLMVSRTVVSSICLAPEKIFPGHTTYPAITTLNGGGTGSGAVDVRLRCGATRKAVIPDDGASWWPHLMVEQAKTSGPILGDVCVRISAGIATGADDAYVFEKNALPKQLSPFAKPAMAGRDLAEHMPLPAPGRVLLSPYTDGGDLLPSKALGALGRYFSRPVIKERLRRRSCASRKPWYAFHDNFPPEILRPKIIFKDIAKKPRFWVDRTGEIVPLHSVYYIVPEREDQLDALCNWLNGDESSRWIEVNCQRAANGFLRLQSSVLRQLPVPAHVLATSSLRKAA